MRLAAQLGLKPADFWSLTPGEFRNLLIHSRWRDAWMVAWMLRPYSDEVITPESLLGLEPEMTDEARDLATKAKLGPLLKTEEPKPDGLA